MVRLAVTLMVGVILGCFGQHLGCSDGMRWKTVCEHGRLTLSCGGGSVLHIVRANYGRTNRNTCRHSAIRTTSCYARRTSLPKVRSACQGKRACSIRAVNSVFGDPCHGTFKYLRVGYRCVRRSVRVAVVCENRRSKTLVCPRGTGLAIISANYGRTNRHTCPHSAIRTTRCYSRLSSRTVKLSCNGRQTCQLQAKNSIFGDPCRGTYKYLRVTYRCVRQYYKVAILCEHRRGRIACPRGHKIAIHKANYGRTNKLTCPTGPVRTTRCSSSKSMCKVKKSCHGKSSCWLRASNSVFGDPCVGTFKYLRVSYRCIRKANPVRYATICEHRHQILRCPGRKKLFIIRANYGRTNRRTCKSGPIRTTRCFSHGAKRKVSSLCHRKSACVLRASNSVFGDPCRGTYKYLHVSYRCI